MPGCGDHMISALITELPANRKPAQGELLVSRLPLPHLSFILLHTLSSLSPSLSLRLTLSFYSLYHQPAPSLASPPLSLSILHPQSHTMRATLALRDAVHTPLIRFVGRRSVPRKLDLISTYSFRS